MGCSSTLSGSPLLACSSTSTYRLQSELCHSLHILLFFTPFWLPTWISKGLFLHCANKFSLNLLLPKQSMVKVASFSTHKSFLKLHQGIFLHREKSTHKTKYAILVDNKSNNSCLWKDIFSSYYIKKEEKAGIINNYVSHILKCIPWWAKNYDKWFRCIPLFDSYSKPILKTRKLKCREIGISTQGEIAINQRLRACIAFLWLNLCCCCCC